MTTSAAAESAIESRLAVLETSLGIDTTNPSSFLLKKDIESRVESLLRQSKQTGIAGAQDPSITSSPLASLLHVTPKATLVSTSTALAECDRLSQSLEAGSALSFQGTTISPHGAAAGAAANLSAIPLLYRRSELLSRYDELQRCLEHLSKVRDLCLVGRTSVEGSSSSTGLSEDPSTATNTAAGGSGGVGGDRSSKRSSNRTGKGANTATTTTNTTTTSTTTNPMTSTFVANAPILSSDRYDLVTDPSIQRRLEDVESKIVSIRKKALLVAMRVDDICQNYRSILSLSSQKMVLADEQIHIMEQQQHKKEEE